MPDYNHAVIRELLSQSFDTAEINTLAFDLFPKLRADFPEAMTKSVRIERIVDHAGRNGRFPPLLKYVKTHNKHQYAQFEDRLIQKDVPPKPDAKLVGWQQRKADLERHIEADLELLVEFEEELRLADNPRRKRRYRQEIERQEQSLANYRSQLDGLEGEIVEDGLQETTVTNQQLLDEISAIKQTLSSQLSGMEERLAQGQQNILAHIDQQHRATVQTILAKLNDNQYELVGLLLDAAERDQIERQEVIELHDLTYKIMTQVQKQPTNVEWQQLLAALEEPTSLQQKFKLILPLVPFFLEYEAEFTLDDQGMHKILFRTLRDKWTALGERFSN